MPADASEDPTEPVHSFVLLMLLVQVRCVCVVCFTSVTVTTMLGPESWKVSGQRGHFRLSLHPEKAVESGG